VRYVDAAGHDQLLFGVWRTTRLRAALPSDPHGKPMRLLAGPNVLRFKAADEFEVFDCDTKPDLDRARQVATSATRAARGAGGAP